MNTQTPSPIVDDPTELRHDLPRRFSCFDAATVVVGSIIGAGIFKKASGIAQLLPDPSLALWVWVVCGALSLFGALVIAEMGAMFPHSGGLYLYLREAYGPLVGFLFGWSMLAILQTGSIAGLAAMVAEAMSSHLHFTHGEQVLCGMALIAIVSTINILSVRATAGVQNVFTIAKSIGLMLLIFGAAVLSQGSWENLRAPQAVPITGALLAAFGLAMIKALWAYDGWVNLSFVAGEVRDPQRNLPRALMAGMAFVIIVYVAANAAYHYALPLDQVQNPQVNGQPVSVAEKISSVMLGGFGLLLMSAIIMVSTAGSLNSSVLSGARVYFAMAQQRLFFPALGAIHQRYLTPHVALAIQAVWAMVLLGWWGRFERITDNVIFAYWIFYALAGGAILILRHRYPDAERPYRCLGYPWSAILFILVALFLIVNVVLQNPGDASQALLLLGSGGVLYPLFKRMERAKKA